MSSYQELESRLNVFEDKLEFLMNSLKFSIGIQSAEDPEPKVLQLPAAELYRQLKWAGVDVQKMAQGSDQGSRQGSEGRDDSRSDSQTLARREAEALFAGIESGSSSLPANDSLSFVAGEVE